MSVTVEIVNYKEVDLWLRSESKEFEKSGWQIIADTALTVMDSMKRYILPSVITGRLRASVHTEKRGTGAAPYQDNEGNVFDSKFESNPQDGELWVGTNVVYAKKVDVGGRAKGYFDKAVRDGQFYMAAKINRVK